MIPIIVTGCAGFIGSFVTERLLKEGKEVVGVDNLNDYYDIQLKKDRLARLLADQSFSFEEADLCDEREISRIFQNVDPEYVIHLAAQAGVRY